MKVLLAGARGQVGREIERCANDAGYELSAHGSDTLDISREAMVFDVVRANRPDVVINAAAFTAVDRAEDEKQRAFAVNRDGPRHLAAACAEAEIPLLHVSTDYVFDGSAGRPYREDDPVAPLGVYGESKWQGEQAVRDLLPQHVILRTSWVFGSYGQNFVKTMLRLARERSELRVVADQQGCPTHAAAIAATLVRLAVRASSENKMFSADSVWGTYHYCGTPITTWHTFAEAIVAGAKARVGSLAAQAIVPIETAEFPTRAARPAYSVLDCSLLQSRTEIHPEPWQLGLDQVLDTIIDHT